MWYRIPPEINREETGISGLIESILNFSAEHPELATGMTTVFRWIFVVLAAYILLISIVSLLSTRATPEIWGYYMVEGGANYPITHWENVIGRSRSTDLNVPVHTVSNNHALLVRRHRPRRYHRDGRGALHSHTYKSGGIQKQ